MTTVTATLDRSQVEGARARRGHRSTLFALCVSASLVAVLYAKVDAQQVFRVFANASVPWLIASVGAIVPITLIVALRFLWTAPKGSLTGFGESLRLTLASTAFNLVLPAKSGDLIKSYVVSRSDRASVGVALSILVYERLSDMLGLLAWCLVGWVISPPRTGVSPVTGVVVLGALAAVCLGLLSSERSADVLVAVVGRALPSARLKRLRDLATGWPELHRELRGRRRWIVLLSVGLWLGHLAQMWLFTLAVRTSVPFTLGLGVFALTVLAGQLPLTFAGFGARDVALVVLLSGYIPAEAAAAVGLLSATRGVIPALAAAPIVRPYLAMATDKAVRWRQR